MHVHFPAIPTVPPRPGALKAHRDALLARLATCITDSGSRCGIRDYRKQGT
jgi:hypothetical protein